MSEETFTSVPLVGFKFLSEIENIAYSRLVRAAYVKEEFVGWVSKKDAISKLNFIKSSSTIYKILNKLEELGLLFQKEKSYKVYILSSTAKRENGKWVDTRVYLDDNRVAYNEYPAITTFESYQEVINEWTRKFSDEEINKNKIEQVCGFTKLSDKVLYNTEIDLQNKIDWLRMRRIKDLEINTSKSKKPFRPNWKSAGTILGLDYEELRKRITSTICATKDKKGFITNYASSNDGFSFDIADELVNSDYSKRTDNKKKTSDEEAKELTKDVLPAEEQIAEMIEEESKETQNIILETNDKDEEIKSSFLKIDEELPENFDDFLESIQI
jgi:DNA-binding PadR family transcriptional regulator